MALKNRFLLIFPLLLLVFGLLLKKAHGPYYLMHNSDPEYAYLFNGLVMAEGKDTPGMFFHPGTTVQYISAFIIRITHFATGTLPIVEDVMSNTELYLSIINIFFNLLTVIALFILGKRIFIKTNNAHLAILTQTIPFASIFLMESLVNVSPDPLIFSCSLILLTVIVDYFYHTQSEINNSNDLKYVFYFSIISGFLLVTKIICIPILILPFLMLRNRIHKLIFVPITVFFFFIFFAPALHKFKYFWEWLVLNATNSGQYGKGSTSGSSVLELIGNIKKIFFGEPVFILFAIIGLVGLVILFVKKIRDNIFLKLFYAVFITIIVQIIFTAKNFVDGSYHYTIPALILIVPFLIVTFLLIASSYSLNVTIRSQKIFTYIFIFSLSSVFLWKFVKRSDFYYNGRYCAYEVEKEIKNYPDSYLITSYQSSNLAYAIKFGLDFILPPERDIYTSKASVLFPNQLFYQVWDNYLCDWNGKVEIDSIYNKGKVILVQGNTFEDNQFPPGLVMKGLDSSVINRGSQFQMIFKKESFDRLFIIKRN